MYRIEKDSLGEKQIPADALYGINALRAKENFPDTSPFPVEWYRAAGITNLALVRTGNKCGNYTYIDPTEHANIYQSTNDVIPTALTIAAMRLLRSLEDSINALRQETEKLEREHREKLRPGYKQMQEAVPSSFGLLFSACNDALSCFLPITLTP